MTVDISKEYLSWDNVETLRFTVNKNGEPQPRGDTDYGLEVNPRDRRSSYQGVRTDARQTTFWIPVADLGDDEPDGNMVIERASDNQKFALDQSRLVNLGTSKSHWDVLVTRFQDEP